MISGTLAAIVLSGFITGCGYSGRQGAMNTPGTRNVGYYTNPATGQYNNQNLTQRMTPRTNQNTAFNHNQAVRISKKVAGLTNVKHAQVLVNNSTVAIGVTLSKTNVNKTTLKQQIHQVVRPMAGNKKILITTDQSVVQRMKNVNARISAGATGREVRSDVTGIINDIANAIKRPFQNNAR